jgi:RNA polymerase sigma factor (sigma-70 family)
MAERATERKQRSEQNARHCAWLAREEWAYLARIARRRGAPADEVDDVVQDGLVDVLRSFAGPDDDAEKIRAFAGRCVERRALKRWRRARRKEDQLSPLPELDLGDVVGTTIAKSVADEDAIDPAEAFLTSEEVSMERELLLELPEDQRAALVLRAAGYSTEEICRRLDVSPRALRKRVTKANERLARLRRERGF